MPLGLGLGLRKIMPLLGGGGDPLAGIPFDLRLQTHMGDNVPLGLYQDTACTVPAVTDGDSVAAWRDELSGNGHTYIQADSQKMPLLIFESGVPKLWFDGVDDFLQNDTTLPSTNIEYSMFSLQQASDGISFYNGREVNGYGFWIAGGSRSVYLAGVTVMFDGAVSASEEVWTSERTSPTTTLRINGVGQSLTDSTATPVTPAQTSLVGARNGGSLIFSGYISAALLSTPQLSSGDRDAVESYLSTLNS